MNKWMCSADSHIIEPQDVWTKRVPSKLRDRAPRYEDRGAVLMTVVDGKDSVPMPKQAFGLPDGSVLPAEDVPARLKLLDDDGVWAEALIGNLAGTVVFGIEEPEFALACARAYNDWLAEIFVPYGDRQVGIAFVPVCVEPAASVKEIERIHALGLKGFTLPLWPPEPYFFDKFEPIWEAAAGLKMPISFHAHTGTFFRKLFLDENNPENFLRHGGGDVRQRRAVRTAGGFAGSPVQGFQAYQVTGWFVGAGVLERYPDLHLVFVECGAGWLVSALGWLDFVWQKLPGAERAEGADVVDAALGIESWPYDLKPSDYVHRQVHATFQDEPAAIQYRYDIGLEQLMWGSDFPHPEGTWPHSREFVAKRFAGVDASEREKILGGTFAKLYGLKLPRLA